MHVLRLRGGWLVVDVRWHLSEIREQERGEGLDQPIDGGRGLAHGSVARLGRAFL
jgi:hypothetical protein